MFDIRNEKHVEDRSVLFIEEERLDDPVAAILRSVPIEEGQAVQIATGDDSMDIIIETVEDAEYLIKALEKAIEEDWWSA